MYPRVLLEQLLSLLESRGHLGPRARARVLALINQGVHPEQIFVGGGIVSPEAYRSYLAELTGIKIPTKSELRSSDRLPPGFTRELIQRQKAIPLGQNDEGWHIGYVQPWDRAVRARVQALAKEQDWEMIPNVLLKAEWNKHIPSTNVRQTPHVRVAREVDEASREAGLLEQWYVDPHHPRPGIHEDTRVTHTTVPGAYLPALARRLRRRLSADILVDTRALERGTALRVQQKASSALDHPSNWLQSLPSEQEPSFSGLSVYIGADPLFRQLMQDAMKSSIPSLEQWRDDEAMKILEPRTEDQEFIKHALMAGKSATIQVTEPKNPWWEQLGSAGVPVRVIHKQVFPEGESWISYEL